MSRRASGFGYVSSSNEYKLVTIIFEARCIEAYVYTLGSGNERRNLGKFDVGNRTHWQDGTFLNGVLYWWDSWLKSIFTFDLASEKFCQQLSSPPLSSSAFEVNGKLGVLDGCLSFAVNKRFNGADCLDVWLMNKKDDNHGMEARVGHQSLDWSEMFMVYDRDMFAVTKNHDVLTYSCIGNHINIHDIGASTSKTIVDFKECFSIIFPHKNTLVSLKELGGEDTKIMNSSLKLRR